MFFRRKRKKDKESKEEIRKIDIPENIRKDMPLLVLDNYWHRLVDDIKTPKIEALEKELNKLIKEQGKLNVDYQEYTKVKQESLDEILALTHEAFDNDSEEAKSQIKKQKEIVEKVNEKFEKIEERLDQVPKEIEEVNGQLIDESITRCYEYITIYQKESSVLDQEIQDLRKTVMKKTEKKKIYDSKADNMYRYLHHLLGPGFTETLDGIYMEREYD